MQKEQVREIKYGQSWLSTSEKKKRKRQCIYILKLQVLCNTRSHHWDPTTGTQLVQAPPDKHSQKTPPQNGSSKSSAQLWVQKTLK